MGSQVGRVSGNLKVTNDVADRLVRLPLWLGIEDHLDRIIDATMKFFPESL